MGVACIELDEIRHGPNWTEMPDDEFRDQVVARTSADAWVIDGNYAMIREVTWGRADTLVWLDFSLAVILWRLFLRTNRRIFRREVLWNGNRERFAGAYLSTDSLYLWVFRSFWKRRRNWPRFLAESYRHLEVVRFRTPGEARRWLGSLPPEPRDAPVV
jgi:hypothetical protein